VSGSTRDALAAAADGLRYAFERYDELSVKGRRASEIDVPLFAPQTTGWPPESIAEWHDLARQARGREDDVDLRGELVERMKRTTRIGGSARFDEQLERRFGAAHSRAREARHRESGASDEFATPQYHDPVDDLLTRTQTQSPQRTRLSRAPAVPDELWEGGRWIGTNSRYFTHEELEAAVEPARAASGLPRDLRDSVEIVERIHGRRVVVGYRGARRPGEDTGWNRGFRVDADGRHVRWWNFEREGAYGRAPIEVRDRPSR